MKSLLKRVNYHIAQFYGSEQVMHLTEEFRKVLFQEIFDCFLVGLRQTEKCMDSILEILSILQLNRSELECLVLQNAPAFEISN